MELLSPAGNLTKLKIALKYGADAVYLGGKEASLRSNAEFNIEDLAPAIELVHSYNTIENAKAPLPEGGVANRGPRKCLHFWGEGGDGGSFTRPAQKHSLPLFQKT